MTIHIRLLFSGRWGTIHWPITYSSQGIRRNLRYPRGKWRFSVLHRMNWDSSIIQFNDVLFCSPYIILKFFIFFIAPKLHSGRIKCKYLPKVHIIHVSEEIFCVARYMSLLTNGRFRGVNTTCNGIHRPCKVCLCWSLVWIPHQVRNDTFGGVFA